MELSIAISQLLAKYECTYNETEQILSMLTDEFRMQREKLEYRSIRDLMCDNKHYNASDDVIQELKFIEM